MIKEGKFGIQEAVCLTTITISTKVFFTSPAFLTNFVGTAGWQMTMISNMTTFLAFTFICLLMKRFPGKDIIEIFGICLGPAVGFLLSFIFAAAFLMGAATLLREFVDVIKVFIYPDTTPSILVGSFVIAVAVICYLGLETLARVSKLSAYVLLIFFLMLLLLAIQNYRLTNLFPILGYGVDKTILHGLRRSSAYDEVLILTVFAASLQGSTHLKKAGYISLLLSGLIIGLGLFCFTLAFPVQTTQELTAPIYILAREIKYGSFFQRLDSLFIFIWIFSTIIAVCALFFCALSCYCKTFRLQDHRPVMVPMLILLYTLTFLSEDFSNVLKGGVQTSREYGWAIFYVLPLITLIVAALRKKKGSGQNA